MADLNDTEAQKLFQEVSQSIRDNDTLKLDELVDVKPDEGNPEPEVPTPADEPEQNTETQDTPTSNDGTQETSPPADNAAEEGQSDEGASTPDELATLREQLENIKKENHHLKSQTGRMPHLQSRVKELDKKLEELRNQLSSPSSQPSAKIRPEIQKKLAKLKETDPELAEIMEDTLSSASDGVARELLNAEIIKTESLRKAEYEAYHNAEWQKLVEVVPNAKDIFSDPHWAEWKSKQSRAVQELAGSDSAEDVIFAINRYAADMVAMYPELGKGNEEAPAPSTDPVTAEKAKQVETARQQRKETSVVAGTPNAAGQVSTPSDAMSLFKKYSEEIRKERLGT